jgi:pyruvate, orthophosphate dikinase
VSGATAAKTKYVYGFAEGSREMRDLLGGKGANIAEMSRIGPPVRVPGGFTITTEACVAYMESGGEWPEGLDDQVADAVTRLEEESGRKLGDADDPLLVSVRSGARESMPGMLDTILNLGLNDQSVRGLAKVTGNERFAWDCYRRLVQMFGNVVQDIEGKIYEEEISEKKQERGVAFDTELKVTDLESLTDRFKQIFRDQTGRDFPKNPRDQLRDAIKAVFDSWNGERAIAYRRENRIPDDWGTAVNVQQMVFGNKGESSGSGVAFSRNENTGESSPSGNFLINAQGEDVVSGVRNAPPLAELGDLMPEVHAQLVAILHRLETHYKDMQDVEFTIEEGTLYLLQTRSAQRPAQAIVRVAVDMVQEGLLTKQEAITSIDATKLVPLLHPTFDPNYEYEPLTRGEAASPGAAKGKIVFTASDAVERAFAGEKVVLVRPSTDANDVVGFFASEGVLTSEGTKAAHAALVARGMGLPCICGASQLQIDLDQRIVEVEGQVLREGDLIAIDGSTGNVTTEDVPLIEPEINPYFLTVLGWADELRTIGVRTNADTPEDARKARELGAEGIGLCRTEHMFMEADRQPKMRAMIMAGDNEQERGAALDELLPLQRQDFEGLFEAMEGLPVTIRLLDPPLHEFLPDREELLVEIERRMHRDPRDPELKQLEAELLRVRQLAEANPMLGTRGCRLGILSPDIYRMQVRAIIGAALAVRARTGITAVLEIMIPLIDYERELELLRELVVTTAAEVVSESGEAPLDFAVGTMIELPRACLLADQIVEHADFFSFGTNDLTQTALGFSRDDIEARILARYIETRILDRSPFETIDVPGVGALIRMAVEKARAAKSGVKLGVCGEHGGDPESVRFFCEVGLDYVSCSPYRVPIARVAAAQAATT